MRRNSDPDDNQLVQEKIPTPSMNPAVTREISIEEMIKVFFKDHVIVWHDPDVDNEENQQYIAQLKRICEVFIFTEWEKAKDHTQSTQAVCHVITSGTNGELLVKEIFERENVRNIYIFSANKEDRSFWAKGFAKVSCIETNTQNLINQIQQDLLEWYQKASSLNFTLPTTFAPIFNDSPNDLRIIPNFKNREQAKDDFMRLSREIYPDPTNVNLLEEFDLPDAKPVEKEIIVKCSLEEMMKAFFKDYVIVWHDPNAANQENQQYILQLKKFCEVLTFTEWEKAKHYIQSTQAVCHVISSGTNGEVLTKEISTSQSVANIYIFCANKEYHLSWAKGYQKVSCIETNIQSIIKQIQQNLLEWYKTASSLKLNLPAFAPIFNDSDKSEMNSLHLYLKVIPNFKNREQAKEDFVALSSRIYSDPINTQLLEEFEKDYNEYNKEKALKWYTRESFLYKVTNNCLRIATSDSIQYSRLLLKDMEQAIKDQYQEKSKDFKGLLYRGAYLSDNEWMSLKENLDKEVEMHGFLSVSKKKDIAVNFMNTDPSKKVFITIMVPKGSNDEEQGFAEMEKYSHFPGEREILFNVRSRFTVLETEDDYEYSENATCRHLVLLYGAQGFRKYLTEQNPYYEISIASKESISCTHCETKNKELFFVSIYEEDYYCKACVDYGVAPFLCVPSTKEVGTAEIQGCLLLMNPGQEKIQFYGYKCCNCQAKKQKSYFICTDCSGKKWCENCFDTCLKVGHNIILETHPYTFWCERMSASELTHLEYQENLVAKDNEVFLNAEMYFESHEYEKAIEYYSLYIQENEARGPDNNVAMSYNNIGLAYDSQGEYKKALENYLKSLDIQKSVYEGENHLSVARSYGNIGNAYYNQGEYKKALEYYLKSLDIKKSVYEEDSHHSVATSYNNIGLVYKKQGEHKKALEYYLKSLDIRKSVYGDNHPSVATSYNNIGSVYKNQGEYERALEYYLKSLDIQKSIYGDNHPSVATSFHNIGQAHHDQGEYKKALENHLKSLDIRKSVHGDNHPDVATSYRDIGLIYQKQEEYENALKSFEKSLDIRKSIYGDDHNSTVEIQIIIDMIRQDKL